MEHGFDTLINQKDTAVKVLVQCTRRFWCACVRKDDGGTQVSPSPFRACVLGEISPRFTRPQRLLLSIGAGTRKHWIKTGFASGFA